jgi:hypothetical protein
VRLQNIPASDDLCFDTEVLEMCGKVDETPRSKRTSGIRRHLTSARGGLPFSGLINAKQDEKVAGCLQSV